MQKSPISLKTIALLKTTHGRREQKKFIVEGARAIRTCIEAQKKPIIVYVHEEQLPHAQEFIPKKNLYVISHADMKKISTASTPSGILAVFPRIEKQLAPHIEPTLICVGISDPGNLGTIIRTCAALGKKSLILIEGVDPYSPKVIQASAGACAQIDMFQTNWNECKKIVHQQKKSHLCALVPRGGKDPRDLDLKKSFLVVGSEAHGLDKKIIQDCDQLLTLAMPGKTESLNAAIAGSIALYLATLDYRQK